jgi:hypothetical protein
MTIRNVTFVGALVLTVLCVMPAHVSAQMTYRLKGTVKDAAGKPVANARVHAEALSGFRGEQFVGQKEFSTTSNAGGEWTILGLTSGIWAFEATAPGRVPQAIVLPINFTNRKPQSATGGSFPWDLPLELREAGHSGLEAAATAATQGAIAEAIAAAGTAAGDTNPDVLCGAGEVSLLVRQHSLAQAIFEQLVKRDDRHPCGRRGIASAALMRGDYDLAAKMLWSAIDVAPRGLKAALGAAVKDLQGISGTKN